MDLLLDSTSHDIVFVNGECPTTATRADAIAQRLKVKLLTFLGEWFLDTEYGIPYFQEIFDKQRSKATVDTIFQEKILEEDGVLNISVFNSELDATRRTYDMQFTFQADDGSSTSIDLDINI